MEQNMYHNITVTSIWFNISIKTMPKSNLYQKRISLLVCLLSPPSVTSILSLYQMPILNKYKKLQSE